MAFVAGTSLLRWTPTPGQLGPQFDDGGRMMLIEARSAFTRAPMHRAKAHLILSAMRHRARELGDRVEFHQVDRYSDVVTGRDDLEVIDPTSYAARRLVRRLGAEILPSRGFVTSEEEFSAWVAGRGAKRLVLEDFYRAVRARTGILMEGDAPVGGQWNYDEANRQPPPKGAVTLGLPEPWWPEEDEIDAEVRADLDRWQSDGRIRLIGNVNNPDTLYHGKLEQVDAEVAYALQAGVSIIAPECAVPVNMDSRPLRRIVAAARGIGRATA